jgi:3D-(3,5/4)-trihydroxycyclohexane-1,2-dione acylhydrolase (decyclizing)
MGYEIAGGLGVRLGAPERDVFVLVGDGSYLMMSSELVTAVQENVKIIVVLVQNHGFASIGALSESLGSQRFGTAYRRRSGDGRLDGDYLPVDLAANVRSLGVEVLDVNSRTELEKAISTAKAADGPIAIHVRTDPLIGAPDSESWWDVPVSQVSELDSTRAASTKYEESKKAQRLYLAPVEGGTNG